MPEISVIVPVYNSEEYLSKCVQSILSQTYTNFELILVNDGSSDGSLQLCKKWADKDRRIIVIDKINGGVSSARNAGIEKAVGNWITFIDSDDWVDVDFLEKLYCLMQENKNVDIISTGIRYVYPDKNTEEVRLDSANCSLFNSAEFLSVLSQVLITSPVAKLYRRSIIVENDIIFPVGINIGEDRAFNLSYLQKCKNSVRNSYIGYNYRKGVSDSLTSIVKCNEIKINIQYWNDLYQFFSYRGYLNDTAKEYLARRLYNMIVDYILCPRYNKIYLAEESNNINWHFLKENYQYITSPIALKILVACRWFNLLRIVYYCKK